MKSFDDFKKEFGVDESPYNAEHYIIESSYKAGAQSRQAEIDELQKRIDEVIEYIGTDFNDYYTGVMVESIHEILKGDQS